MTQCQVCNGLGKTLQSIDPLKGAVINSCFFCSGTGNLVNSTVKLKQKSTTLPEANTSVGDIFKHVGKEVVHNFAEAGKQEISSLAAHKMVEASKQLASSLGFDLPPNPVIDKALALGMPVLIMLGCRMLAAQDQTFIPKGLLENLNAASGYALKGVSKETVSELTAVAMPFMLQIAAIGAQAMAGQLGAGQMLLNPEIIDETDNNH